MIYNILLQIFNLPQLSPLFQYATIISENSFIIIVADYSPSGLNGILFL